MKEIPSQHHGHDNHACEWIYTGLIESKLLEKKNKIGTTNKTRQGQSIDKWKAVHLNKFGFELSLNMSYRLKSLTDLDREFQRITFWIVCKIRPESFAFFCLVCFLFFMLIQNYKPQFILYIVLMLRTKPQSLGPLIILATGDSQHRMLTQRPSSSVNLATCHAYVSLQNEILNQEWRSDTIMDKKTYSGGRYGDNKSYITQQSLGPLANVSDGRFTAQNAVPKTVQFSELGYLPRLCLFAKWNIEPGMEIRYDYGQKDLLWRKVWWILTIHLIAIAIPPTTWTLHIEMHHTTESGSPC